LKRKHIYLSLVMGLILVLGLVGAVGCKSDGGSDADVIFSEDFSRDNGDWDVFSDSNGEVFYEGGWFHLINYTTAPYDTMSIMTGQNFSDFILEVEVKLIDGTDDNWQGVVCRYQDDGNYYVFNISADGYFYISRFLEYEQLALYEATPSSYINLGWDTVNTMYIECTGSKLKLSVNGHMLASVTDNAFSEGEIGLLVTSWDGDFSEIAFDNLVVTGP
jgi:hypothetical protein